MKAYVIHQVICCLFHPWEDLTTQRFKATNDTSNYPKVIGIFLKRRGKGTCKKGLELPNT